MPLDLDWNALQDEAQRHFVNLLRLNTTNPPGNERIAADYIKSVLDKEGIGCTILESAPGRANLVARLSGKRKDTGLLLTSHMDVVPAERAHWKHDPFAAEIHEGMIWARGTIDMKHMTAYSLTAFITAKRQGWDLQHDLVLNAFADEEAGCEFGARWMVDKHPDRLASKYAFNEIGAFTIHAGKERIYPIQVAEKGYVWLKMRATGDPGHGSMPHDNNAVVKLARAVEKLGRVSPPLRIHPVVEGFMDEMGRAMGPVSSLFLKLARNPVFSEIVTRKIMPKDKAKVIHAQLRNTVNPTGLSAGVKVNVIPSSAEAILDCRVMPGVSQEELIREITEIVGPGFTFELINKGMAVPQDYNTPMMDLLVRTLKEADPGCKVVPYLIVGFTDNSELTRLGITCYGYTPIKLPDGLDFASLFHGHNERIPVDGFRWGVKTFLEAVHRYVVKGE